MPALSGMGLSNGVNGLHRFPTPNCCHATMRRQPWPRALNCAPLPGRTISQSMVIWISFAIMTAGVLAALLWPLGREGKPQPVRAAFGRAVFRDQLAELDRDVARGAIGREEAAGARNEIARRM